MVRWDNYVVEADLTFEQVLNSARWASVVVRASDNGLNQYNQMAVRQNGSFEFAYRILTNSWSVPVAGKWDAAFCFRGRLSLENPHC